MSLRRTRAIAAKELIHIVRDPRSLIMALAIPLLLLLLFGYALSLDVDRIPTLILDADRTPESREVIERFRGSRYFHIGGIVDQYATIQQQMDQGACLLAVVIDQRFSEELRGGREAQVQLLVDGSDANTASIALGYAEGLLQSYALEWQARVADERGLRVHSAPVQARLRVWYNSDMKSKNYIVPGLVAVILMIIAALLTSLTIAREWEMGSMEQLLSTPVRPTELVLGKMAAYFGVGFIDTLTALGVGVFIFDVPLRGSSLLVLGTSCLFLFGALCWGILLSALTRQQLAAFQLGILTSFLPAFLLSGFIFSIENMPRIVQLITHIFPARYFVTILKGIFLKGVGVQVLWVELLFLLIYAVVVFLLATRTLRRKLA